MTKKYDVQSLRDRAKKDDAYWVERAVLEFMEEVIARMEQLDVSRSELAARINVSPAYVTKILRGSSNFTLQSMVKIGRAIGCELRTHLQPEGMRSLWFDRFDEERHVKVGFRTSHEMKDVIGRYKAPPTVVEEEKADETLALAS